MTTSVPLPIYHPRYDGGTLSDEQNESIDCVMKALKWPLQRRMHTVAFLRDVEWDEDEAVSRIRKFVTQIESRTVSLRDYLPFLFVNGDIPSPCGVVLEDGRGQCARDKQGNPLILIYGNYECAREEAMNQMCCLLRRVQKHTHDTQLPHCTYVFDMKPRMGLHAPGAQMDFAFLKFMSLFPQSFTLYICAAPSSAASTFSMIPSSLLANVKVCGSYDVLHDVIDPVNMLPSWHPNGTFDFDLNKYRAYMEQNGL